MEDLPQALSRSHGMKLVVVGAFLLSANLLSGCGLVREVVSLGYGAYAGLRPMDIQRQKAPYDIEPICVRATLNYLIPVQGGVVLIDAGYEESGDTLKAALGDRTLLGILLTHAHVDHRLGAHQFDAPVYVGAEDARWLRGEDTRMAFWPRVGRLMMGRPPPPKVIIPVEHQDQVTLGGAQFYAIHLPGHTPGSLAWRYRDVLFTGDAVQAPTEHGVSPAPQTVTANMEQAWKSMERLSDEPFLLAFDGHNGRIDDAKEKIIAVVRAGKNKGYPQVSAVAPSGCVRSFLSGDL
jgi:glyoxylase-like metal-dependent hydrolase (beta-lactamase superfamily II)